MRKQSTPTYNIFTPVKIFFALLLVTLIFFAPIVNSERVDAPTEPATLQEVYPALKPFASSADACPWACIKCTSWDQNAWPRTCLTYECMDASGDCGGSGGGGGGYQPPTISHVLTCSNTGNNGWCIGTLNLDLTASDPQGQTVVISGTVNGVAFACPSGQTTCSIPLPEAAGTATYKVDSATGLSASGSTSYQLDLTTPQIDGSINGSSGNSGWYTSQTSVSALASDALSGLASLEVNADNAGWASYSDTTFTDGMHTIQFRAIDNAGNVTETALQSVNVDITAPTLNLATTGTMGQNSWYVSAVTLTPTASDATSGLYSLEVTTDGSTWSSINAPLTLTDGVYTVQFRATDNAGNISQTPIQQVKIDATTPSLSLNVSGTRGQNDWFISSTTVTPNASDAGSGINKIEAKIDNGTWSIVNSSASFVDGVHTYQYKVTDNAGNVTETPSITMMVDTVPPAIAMSDDTLALGDTLMYDLEDSLSGLWITRAVIEDEDEKYKKLVWVEEITGKKSNNNAIRWDGVFADGTKAAPGQYFITLKVSDQAGNETMQTAIVEVTAFNSILPIPAFTPPASAATEPIQNEASTTNEQSFGGGNNGTVGTETTTTNGETVFASVNLQAGGTSSFTAGNQSSNVPNTNSNILWGAAAATMLGATLAEWQKKREEEAARLAALIASNAGQGDEDEVPADVLARRRGKVIAKNQAKRAQEQAWESARTQQQAKPVNQLAKIDTEEERLEAYKQTASYQARQESYTEYYAQKAMEAQRAGERNAVAIAEEYKAQEQAKQNAVSAARWAGVASVAQAKQESEASSQACFLPTQESTSKENTISEGTSYLVDIIPGIRMMMAGAMLDGRPFKGGPRVKPLVNSDAMGGWAEKLYKFLGGKTGGVLNDLELNQSVVGKSISSLDDAGPIVAENAVKVTKGTAITAGVVSLVTNFYDYEFGEHKDKGLGQEFLVSTLVDALSAVGIGLAAAAIVSLAVASVPFTVSVTAVVGVTVLVGIAISAIFSTPFPIPGYTEPTSASDAIKEIINTGVDHLQSWWQENNGG